MSNQTEPIGQAISQLRWTVPPQTEAAFNAWYDEEHTAEVVNQPGVLSGRRFVREQTRFSAPAEFNYLTIYQLRDLRALATPEYQAMAAAPSERTMRIGGSLPRTREVATDITAVAAGQADHAHPATHRIGGALMHAMTRADPDIDDDFNRWYDEEHLPMLVAVEGVYGARRFRCTEPSREGFLYIAIYELADASVIDDPALFAAGQPTAWRRRLGDRMQAHMQIYRALAAPLVSDV